jgi:hypothetical protein
VTYDPSPHAPTAAAHPGAGWFHPCTAASATTVDLSTCRPLSAAGSKQLSRLFVPNAWSTVLEPDRAANPRDK